MLKENDRLALKVINLWSPPGNGKSTCASGLFHLMKTRGMSVELVTEYAKDLTWDQNWTGLRHQPSVTAIQDARLARLVGKVDWAIVDSPIPMGIAYMGPHWIDMGLDNFAWDLYDQYQNFHVLLTKGDFGYDPTGRNQTSAEASVLGNIIDQLFSEAITEEEEFSMETKSGPEAPYAIYNKLIAPELRLGAD